MKFLVDAQLPRRLVKRLREAGHDARHTLDLPRRNRTTDSEIISTAAREDRVVVSKDGDFVNSFLISRRPARLLLIATGNITNDELDALVMSNLTSIVSALEVCEFVELTRTLLIAHFHNEA